MTESEESGDFSSRRGPFTFRVVRALCYHFFRLLAKLLFRPFVKIYALRPDLAERGGACILAANHISHFDPPLIGITVRRKIDWMGMEELFRQPLVAAWFRAIDTFPVDRAHLDRRAVRETLLRLRAGRAIGMFPEGGIRDGERSVLEGASMRPGVAGLAQMTGAPVIPCVIMGSDRCYNLARLWRPGRRVPVWIGFGRALEVEAGADRAAGRTALEESIGTALRELAAEMRIHFALRDQDLPQAPGRRMLEGAESLP